MQHDDGHSEPARILWTGGWDSTFQLLRLVFLNHQPVEPYYLIDEDRPSTGTELLTMKRIRQRIAEMDRSAAELIRPTKYFSVSQIPENPEITNAYNAIKSTRFIGSQYDWLARYCQYQSVTQLQLCIHEDDKAAVVVGPMLAQAASDKAGAALGNQYLGTGEHLVFSWFEFPILKVTKTEMASIAQQHGWSQIMNLTWFCHKPWKGKPCGRCNPCRYTIEEGLGWRIPAHRRLVRNLPRISPWQVKVFVKRMLAPLLK